MPHGTTTLMRVTAWLMLALGVIYGLTLLPGLRRPGYRTDIDWWLNMTVDALVIVVLALRTVIDRRERAAWLVMTAGLLGAFAVAAPTSRTTNTWTRSRAPRARGARPFP